MNTEEKTKGLIYRKSICNFLGVGKHKFYKLVEAGLPVEKRGPHWIGNMNEIDEWFISNPDQKNGK